MEKSFRAVAESRNIELPASYDLMQLAKLVRHYHPDLDMDMIQAMNDLKPDDPDNERTAFLGQPAITDADAAAFPEFAGKVLSACTSICRHSGYDDSQLWDSHSLLYL